MAEMTNAIGAGRLVLFAGTQPNLDIFMYELKIGFEDIGYETMIFDLTKMDESIVRFNEFIKKPVTAAFTFNNFGMGLKRGDGMSIWDACGIPIISILMDHPAFFWKAFSVIPKVGMVLTIDRNHMKYMQRFYPNISVTGFLPHGGSMPDKPVKPIRERSIEVMFAGTDHGDPRKLPWHGTEEEKERAAFEKRVTDILTSDTTVTLEDAIERILREEGIDYSEADLMNSILDNSYIQLSISFYYREKMIRTLLENGIHLTLFGCGWDEREWSKSPDLDLRGQVSPWEVVDAMQDAKVVLSTTTWFKDGTHDRVFNGMLCGAAVISDSSVYFREEFDESQIVFFDLNRPDEMAATIKELLADPDRMQKLADNGREAALAKHTWQHRARELHTDLLEYL